jgi:(R,R)-butanediol dehydrogenase/meso-butanediol dehydrogenase/diacetyl reductase
MLWLQFIRVWRRLFKGEGGKTMKAAVWYQKEDIRVEDVPDPEVNETGAKVKIKTCGICGSDLHEFRDGPFIIPSRPHPLTNRSGGPVILGHEFSSEVVEVGEKTSLFSVGDRVVVNPLIYCGQCHYCKRGQHIMCVKLGTYGFAADGAFAEYAVFPEQSLFKLPDSVSDEMGAFVEPLAVAVHAVKRSRMKAGDTVAIVGAGPIGLLVMQAARACGAGQVFVIEPMKARREMALKTGGTAVFDPTEGDAGKAIANLTEGLRADIVFDCVGNQPAFYTAVKAGGRRSKICVVGLALQPIEVPFIRLWGQEKEMIFSSGYEDEFPAAIAFLADKRIDAEPLISARIPLDDLVEKGIKPLMKEPDKNVKILVCP